MKNKTLSILALITILGVSLVIFTGCGSNDSKKNDNNNEKKSKDKEYGITKTIYYDDKYSVKIKFPDEHYDYKPDLKDTASFSGDGYISFKKYSNKDSEIHHLQRQLDVAKKSETYTTYFEEVKTEKINNMDVHYIYYMDNKHNSYRFEADIYIKPDAKYYIKYYPDEDEVTNEKEAYSKFVEIVKTIGKIKEL